MKKIFVVLILILSCSIYSDWMEFGTDGKSEMFTASQRNHNSTLISFSLPGYELEELEVDAKNYQRITFPEEGEFMEVGKPALPRFTRLIAIPDEGSVEFDFNITQEMVLSDILPFPAQPLTTESGRETFAFELDEQFYQAAEVFPQRIVEVGDPAIMRDLRIVSVTINPFQYNPQTNELMIVKSVDITVTTKGSGGINKRQSGGKISRSFESLYQAVVLNYEEILSDEIYQQPSYLFIAPNDNTILNTLQTLVDWKKLKGFDVTLANTSTTGTTFSSIKNYIQNAYNVWENPPEFICLVGDAGVAYLNIPTDYMDSGPGDHGYVRLDGNDILADAFIGRLSIASNNDLQTIISKIINYEKYPFMQNTDWYQKAFLLGDPGTSGQSVIDTKRSVKQMIETTHPHYQVTENYTGNWVSTITSNFNSGISYFNYRGFGNVSGFNTYHIDQFTNGRMLPFCVLLTCNTGDFVGSYDSYNERFLKAGTPSQPKGGIGAISTATGQTHTTFNNCMDAGIYYGIFMDGIYHMGGALNRGKLNLYQNYPSNPANAVYRFSYWNNLMGDPGLELWTDIPADMIVDFESNLALGAGHLAVNVTDTDGAPLQDVWVTALKDNEAIFATGYTDVNGNLILVFEANEVGAVNLTFTKHNFTPVLETFSIGQSNRFVQVESFQIDDDNIPPSSGNNDGNVNPGEIIELAVEMKNHGSLTASNVNAAIICNSDFVNVTNSSVDYGSISPNATASGSDQFVFEVSPACLGGYILNFQFTITDDSGSEWTDYLEITVAGANLYAAGHQILNDPNGILDPGETVDLSITLENIGFISAENISGILSCQNSFIEIVDDSGYFGNIAVSGTSNNTSDPFIVTADSRLVNGTSIIFDLQLFNAAGFDSNVQITIPIGTLSVTDPVGPDAYGYYIYDDGDVGYLDCPEYDWIEISSIGTLLPMYDTGDMGDLETFELPITFRFYGETYDQITVCTNGFLVPGETQIASYMNWTVPGPLGPSPIIAAFWDDLKYSGGSGVYWYHDSTANYVVVQWQNLRNDYDNAEETFQAILYDSNYYPTALGDSPIKFQYKTINNTNQGSYGGFYVQHGNYATIGIEDPSSTVGLEYTFNNNYPTAAKVLQNEMALLLTGPPIQMDEPYLVLGGLVLNDTNGNGQADYGEDIDLFVVLNNLGEQPATGVSAVITANDPYLTIDSNSSLYEDVPGNGSAANQTPFTLEIAEDCPDGHSVPFTVNVTSDQADWELYFALELNAPVLDFHSVFVDDGDNNILDPGETADIYVSFQNSGGAAALNLITILAENDPYIELNSTTHNFNSIGAGSIGTAIFNITALASAPVGHLASINWSMAGDFNYTADGTFSLVISQVPVLMDEDFSGTWLPAGWTISGGSNWQQGSGNNAGGVSPEAEFYWSPSTVAVQRLISPQLNTLGSQSLDLSFKHYLSHFSGSYWIKVQTTSDGSTWNDAWSVNVTGNIPQQTVVLDVATPDVGSATFQIAWVFDGDSWNTNNWYVDDILLEGGQGAQLGFISGNVTLNGGSGNVQNVNISAGNYSSSPNAAGNYTIPLPAGSYEVVAELAGYLIASQSNVNVTTGSTTTVNFILEALDSPQNLIAEVITNDVFLQWEMPREDRSGSPGSAKQYSPLNSRKLNSKTEEQNRNRNLTGFNIYRNNTVIANINNSAVMEYNDEFLAAGDYEYYVTAVYDDIYESEASDPEQITIVILPPTDLEATVLTDDVVLNWLSPQYGRSLTAYRIYRNNQFIAETTTTSYLDEGLATGNYTYYVTALYGTHESAASNQVSVELTDAVNLLIPEQTALIGNFPNPFNPQTEISFALASTDKVKIVIYNIKGEVVKVLTDETYKPGHHRVIWRGKDNFGNQVASGLYFYKFATEDYNRIDKMLLLK